MIYGQYLIATFLFRTYRAAAPICYLSDFPALAHMTAPGARMFSSLRTLLLAYPWAAILPYYTVFKDLLPRT
jgi:hypothetical protein